MSNNYTKASFLLLVQPDEAELLQLAKDASNMLENHDDNALGRREAFDGLGPVAPNPRVSKATISRSVAMPAPTSIQSAES